MKNSGIEWIGEIPDSWKVVETKFLFDIFSGATPDTNSSDNWDGNINWITPADFKSDDVYVTKGKKSITTQGLNSCSARLVPENSLIFSKRAPIGAVAITRSELCTNQGCLSCVNKGQVVTKYYYYVMRAAEEIYELYGAGTTFKEIAALKFANFILPYPSVSEQETIQRDLSNRIKRVDKLIEVQQAQIDKLKEYKQSVITEAVTKGLDPTVPMKDSGVEWIGMIPKGWNVNRIKFCTSFNDDSLNETENPDKTISYVDIGSVSLSEGITKVEDFVFRDAPSRARRITHRGDIIVSTVRTYLKAIATINADDLIVSTGFCVLRPNGKINGRYIEYYCKSDSFTNNVSQNSYGISYPAINATTLVSFSIPEPSVSEQKRIIDYLDDKCAKIDKLIAIKQAKIDKLQEYKKSLIYEYVTGKKEVM